LGASKPPLAGVQASLSTNSAFSACTAKKQA
jgi:hypothetical protein